ncbi:MAG: Fic family protein [Propionibacteriaceae bacterium]|jgi:Fic family protein|nr:Fic family protein [Propionibacteriaceae bacterium]
MEPLFTPPQLDGHDESVIAQIDAMRAELSSLLRAPRRWQGTLRRAAQAKAIRGSNSIEGYLVSDEDAAAAVAGEPPLDADRNTWEEITGYRRALTYVLNVATSPGFVLDDSVIRSMHFMLLEHELRKSPGNYRTGPIYVMGEHGPVYTGPPAERIPGLVAALTEQCRRSDAAPLVKAALAHLNLVMIHPFRDGNGRMARALQTLVLAQDHLLEPTFSSIEEWLGANTADYYAVLAATGADAWRPERSTWLWVRFNLRAHHLQAQTVRRRFDEASRKWQALDELVAAQGLPDRVADTLFSASLGWRIGRPGYVKSTGLDERTATRDLARLVDAGALTPHGQTRARHYTAGPTLRALNAAVAAQRRPLADPFPELTAEIHAQAAQADQTPSVVSDWCPND